MPRGALKNGSCWSLEKYLHRTSMFTGTDTYVCIENVLDRHQ